MPITGWLSLFGQLWQLLYPVLDHSPPWGLRSAKRHHRRHLVQKNVSNYAVDRNKKTTDPWSNKQQSNRVGTSTGYNIGCSCRMQKWRDSSHGRVETASQYPVPTRIPRGKKEKGLAMLWQQLQSNPSNTCWAHSACKRQQ